MLNPTTYGKIFYYKNIIDDPKGLMGLLDSTDDRLNEDTNIEKWKEWISAGDLKYSFGYQKNIKTNMSDETDPELSLIYKIITDAMAKVSSHYAEVNDITVGSLHQIYASKYPVGRAIGPHVDSYGDDNYRTLSSVIYLNDDYEGGELYFPNQEVKIKPEAGSIVLFPSVDPYYHQSLEIISGMKYAVPGFWYNR